MAHPRNSRSLKPGPNSTFAVFPSRKGPGNLAAEKLGAQREIETGTFASRGKKSGLNPNDIHKLIATQIHDTIYKLVPEQDLNPGEYVLDLFLSEPGSGVYEFGITTAIGDFTDKRGKSIDLKSLSVCTPPVHRLYCRTYLFYLYWLFRNSRNANNIL